MQRSEDERLREHFLRDRENTMNHFSSSSIMGFVDKVLNPRYEDKNRGPLLTEFCTVAVAQGWYSEPEDDADPQASLKLKITARIQDKGTNYITASYFDSKTNQKITVTYHIPDIFFLVLAATLDDSAYEEIESDLSAEERKQNRLARIRTLFDSLFGEEGIEGRCNQGVRHELVGCLNGVYPKSGNERWYFIEDIRNAVEVQVRDYLDSRIKINLSTMHVERGSETVILTLKDYLLFNDYCINGQFPDGEAPKIVSDLQSSIIEELAAWAKDHFLDPSDILGTSSNIKIDETIIGQLISAMGKVTLFKAWEQLQLCAETPDSCGTWLMSIESCKQMIKVVTSWLSSRTPSDIDKLVREISDDFILQLSTLGELVAMGNELDTFYSLGMENFETLANSLSNLPIINSITAFNNIPLKPFSQTILTIKQTLQGLSLERVLWKFISAKQRAEEISGKLIETFKKVVAVKKIDGLTEADITLMLDFISKPDEQDNQDNQDNSDILIWSANHAHHSITLYLVRSVLKEKTTAPSTARLLLGQLSINEALMAAIYRGNTKLAAQVLTILSSYPETFKTILTQHNRNGVNCLMFATRKNQPEVTNRILDILVDILKDDPETLKTVLTQCSNRSQNCLMLAAERYRPEATNRILDMLAKISKSDLGVFKTVLTQHDDIGWNCLMSAACNNYPKITNRILDMLAKISKSDLGVFKTVLTQHDQHNQTCLMIAARNDYPEITIRILDMLAEVSKSNPEILKIALTQQVKCDVDGDWNCLMRAADNKHPEPANRILDILVKISKSDLGVPKTVLTQCNWEGSNCLMLAANNNHPEITNRILDMLVYILKDDPETLKTVLTQCNKLGWNCLMNAANKDHPEITNRILDMLIEISKSDLEVLKTMLTQYAQGVCYNGWNCLMLAADKKHSEIIDRILDVLSKLSSSYPEIIETVLSQKGEDGKICRSMVEDRLDRLSANTSSHCMTP